MKKKKFLETIVFSTFFVVLIGGGVLVHSPLALVDNCVQGFLYPWRSEPATRFFSDATILGNWQLILGLCVALSIGLKRRRERRFILPLWIVVAGSFLSAALIKFMLPYRGLEGSAEWFSFPSGHSTIAVAFYGFVAHFLLTTLRTGWQKWIFPLIPMGAAALVGFSRLYLDAHLFSDVLGGSLLGGVWIMIGIGDLERWRAGFKTWNSAKEFTGKVGQYLTRAVLQCDIFHAKSLIAPPLPFRPAVRKEDPER